MKIAAEKRESSAAMLEAAHLEKDDAQNRTTDTNTDTDDFERTAAAGG